MVILMKISDWDALKTVAWEVITGKPDFSNVAIIVSFLDLTDKPKRYESFATLSEMDYNVNTNTLNWDYSRSGKVIAELAQDSNISVANVYNGAVGLIKVYGGFDLILPANSKKSIDFDYVDAGTNGQYVYPFVYAGVNLCWSRSVCV